MLWGSPKTGYQLMLRVIGDSVAVWIRSMSWVWDRMTLVTEI